MLQRSEMQTLCNSISEIFCNGDVVILSRSNTVLWQVKHIKNTLPFSAVFSGVNEAVILVYENIRYCKISFVLRDNCQLFLLIPAADCPDIFAAVKMVSSILSLLFSDTASDSVSKKAHDRIALLVSHLLYPSDETDRTYTALLAADLGYSLSVYRNVCLLCLEYSSALQAAQIPYIANSIFQIVHNLLSGNQQNILHMSNEHEILFLCAEQSHKKLTEIFNQVSSHVCQNYPVQLKISIGLPAKTIQEYKESYDTALANLSYACKDAANETRLLFAKDFMVQHLIHTVSDEILSHFFDQGVSYLQNHPVMVETIHALISCNMNLLSTAQKLYIHRNTLVLRLEQLKAALDINPLHNDKDRFQLILLSYYYDFKIKK